MAMSSHDQTSLKFQPPQQDRVQNTFRLFHPSSPHPRFPSPHPPLTVHRRHGALEADDISERSSDHTGLNDRSHDNVHVVDQPPGVAVPNLRTSGTSERRNNGGQLAWIYGQYIPSNRVRLMCGARLMCGVRLMINNTNRFNTESVIKILPTVI